MKDLTDCMIHLGAMSGLSVAVVGRHVSEQFEVEALVFKYLCECIYICFFNKNQFVRELYGLFCFFIEQSICIK